MYLEKLLIRKNLNNIKASNDTLKENSNTYKSMSIRK